MTSPEGELLEGLEATAVVMERLAKALANPLRMRILIELNHRPMSPSQFFRECGRGDDSLTKVSRQFRQLESYSVIEEIGKRSGGRRRGGVEHIYRAVQPLEFDNSSWGSLPAPFKDMFTPMILQTFAQQALQAIAAGTIDAREDRHFTWMTVALDQDGWDKVIAETDSHFEFVREEAARAADRIAATGEEPIAVTVALAAFESPPDSIARDPGD